MNPLLLPVAAIQGIRLRHSVEILPPAAGPTTGTAPWPTGTPQRLLVVGESTAVGCGADTNEDAFAGAFARNLARRHGRPTAWTVLGRNGATAHSLAPVLAETDPGVVDTAVLLIGVNDVLTRRRAGRWADDVDALLTRLTRRARRTAVLGIPPFDAFPSLPRALGRYLGHRAGLLDARARAACRSHPTSTWIGSRDLLPAQPDFFARDGFHPSPAGYRRWADAVDARLASTGET